MPSTPLLGITQVSTSQSGKETTINDAILALESAGNAMMEVSLAADTTFTLSALEATRNFIYIAKAATADSILNFPVAVNGSDYTRIIAVRNESGHGLTVKFTTGAGSQVIIPDGETRLLAALEGVNFIVAAEPQAAINFLSLDDTPNAYAGQQGKFLSVNPAGDALIFETAAVFPAFADNEGKVLVVKEDLSGVEWVNLDTPSSFTDLTDTPASLVGGENKLVGVNATGDAIEFVDPPQSEAVEFIAAAEWRVRVVLPGTETQVGFGEVQFLDVDGFPITSAFGTATASSTDTGNEPAFAFDGDFSSGAGWLSDPEYLEENWIAYDFDSPETVRAVRLYPITSYPSFTPTRVAFDYWNGDEWVEVGERLTAPWVEGTPQTFRINGFPLASVMADAPNDGQKYVRRNNAWEPFYYSVPMGFAAAPAASETLLVHCFAESASFLDDWGGSVSYVGANPNALYTLSVSKVSEGVTTLVGTVTITNTGAVTFTTTDGSVTFEEGDVMLVVGQATIDANIGSTAITFKGIRT